MLRVRLLTVVWGKEFIGRFLRLTLRSLAAPRNLPHIVSCHDVAYDIYAPGEDIARIEVDPLFEELSKTVNFRFHPFALTDIDASNSMSHWALWDSAMLAMRQEDVYVITVGADHVFADGAITRWVELFEQGALAIYCPGIQVVAETVEQEFSERLGDAEPASLPLPQMFNMMFRHIHPVMITMFRDSPRWMAHPEFHLRTVRGQGFVQSIITSHSVAFQPNRIKLTPNLCPLDNLDKIAFEPCWYLSAEPFFKYLNLYMRPWQMDDTTLSHYGVWSDGFLYPGNLIESEFTHSYPIDAEITPRERRREELGAHFYVGQMKASRAIHRVWRACRTLGLFQAARWLAAAHIAARLRRRMPIKGPVTLLVPIDEMLQCLAPGEDRRLLAGNARELIATVRGHVLPGTHIFKVGDRLIEAADGGLRALDGRKYVVHARGKGVRIVRTALQIDDVTIYAVDRPLGGVRLRDLRLRDISVVYMRRCARLTYRVVGSTRAALVRVLKRLPVLYSAVRYYYEALQKRRQAAADAQARAAVGQEPHEAAQVTSDATLALYRKALAARAHQALLQLYALFEGNVLAGTSVATVPGAQLRDISGCSVTEIVNGLKDLTRLSPDFGPAWLELGYAYLDNGNESEALVAFDKARVLVPSEPREPGQADQRTIAALEWARLMEERGAEREALAALDATRAAPPYRWKHHLWRAQMLSRLGREEEALEAYERCLEWNHYEGRFRGLLPRKLDDIKQQLSL